MPEYAAAVHQALRAAGVGIVAYVPDVILDPILALIEADPAIRTVAVTREEEAVGILGGAHVGGLRGAMLLQSSGLGNSVNALASFAIPYQVPFLMVMSPRGGAGEVNPAQMPMGRALEPILGALGIPVVAIEAPEDLPWAFSEAARSAFRASLPTAVLLTRKLTGGKDE